MTADDILKHADFVRALARSLVLDQNRADDVAQQTWLTALEKPPHSKKSLRAWLARVTRNFARMSYRSEQRRIRHEKASTFSGPGLTPDEIAIREEVVRCMAEAVFKLDEPYRTTILLRYYDNLSVNEIAGRMKAAPGTVRSRLHRGLEQLRHDLNSRYHGNMDRWVTVLLPLCGLKPAASAGAALTGVIAMSAKLKIGIAIALILGTLFTFWRLVKVDQSDTDSLSPFTVQSSVEHARKKAVEEAAMPGAPGKGPGTLPEDQDTNRMVLSPDTISISGRVVEKDTKNPVEDFQLSLIDMKSNKSIIFKKVHDENGRFSYPLEKGGTFLLLVTTSRFVPQALYDLKVPEDKGLSGLLIQLDHGVSITGRVVDDATGKPVAGALIGTDDAIPRRLNPYSLHRGFMDSCINTVSDQDGRFKLSGLIRKKQKIVALHPDFAEAWFETTPGEVSEIELRLKKGFRIFGKVLADNGKPASNVRIEVDYRDIPIRRLDAVTGPDGRYQTVPYLPAHVQVEASQMRTEPGVPRFTSEVISVDIVDRNVEVDFGDMRRFVTWRGTFYDMDGNPVSKGCLGIDPDLNAGMASYIRPRWLECDEKGRFELTKLVPGYYQVSSGDPNFTGTDSIISEEVHFARPGLVERDIRASGAIVEGRVIEGQSGIPLAGMQGVVTAVLEKDTNIRFKAKLDKDGQFSMKGIPAGTYTFSADVSRRKSRNLEGVRVEKNQVIHDLEITLFKGGWLKLKVTGCMEEPWFDLYLQCSSKSFPARKYNLSTNYYGFLEKSLYLEAGKWSAEVYFRNSGMLEKNFEIQPDKITKLSFDRKDLVLYQGSITIQGSLTRFDGSPLPAARMLILPIQAPGLKGGYTWHDFYTDAGGRFMDEGYRPGRWKVKIEYREHGVPDIEYHFPNLLIPSHPENPFPLHLVLPAGKVKGSFFDSRKKDALSKRSPWWTVFLLDATRKSKKYDERDLIVCKQKDSRGRQFELNGVPPGQYRIKIAIQGYFFYYSDPFVLKEGQVRDLGKIGLHPCGVLDLEVVDADGKPLDLYELYANGTRCETFWVNDPRVIFGKLPLGEVEFRVHKNGYLDKVFTQSLEPYQRASRTIALEAAK